MNLHRGAIAIAGLASGLGCAPETIGASSPRAVTASLAARPMTSSTTSSLSAHRWVDLRSDRSLLCARDVQARSYCWFLEAASPCESVPCHESSHFRAKPFPLPTVNAVAMAVSFPRTLVVRDTGDVVAFSTEAADDVPSFHGAVELEGSGAGALSMSGKPLDSTCARMSSAEVRCQLLGTSVSVAVDVMAITVGVYHACGIRPVSGSRTVVCWGSNYKGQLGDGTRRSTLVPVVVRGLADVIQIDSERHSTCAAREDGQVACWGQPGGSEAAVHSTPVVVPSLADVAEVSVGESHLCARLRSRSVVCLGKNDRNQLGSATPSDDVGRSTIKGLDDVVKLASLGDGTCALRADGSIVCWGLGLAPETVSLPAVAPTPDE